LREKGGQEEEEEARKFEIIEFTTSVYFGVISQLNKYEVL